MHSNADFAGSAKKMAHVNIVVNSGDTQPNCFARPVDNYEGMPGDDENITMVTFDLKTDFFVR